MLDKQTDVGTHTHTNTHTLCTHTHKDTQPIIYNTTIKVTANNNTMLLFVHGSINT